MMAPRSASRAPGLPVSLSHLLVLILNLHQAGGQPVTACYGETLALGCRDRDALVVLEVRYDRVDPRVCGRPWPATKCSNLASASALRQLCHGLPSCTVSTEDERLRCRALPWGADSYLQIRVSYICVPASFMFDVCTTEDDVVKSAHGCATSPGYPGPYQPARRCSLSLLPPSTSPITINLLDYRVSHRHYGDTCPYDRVVVEEEGTEEWRWEVCGEGRARRRERVTGRVTVTLQADTDTLDEFNRGFLICWQSDDEVMGAVITPAGSPTVKVDLPFPIQPSTSEDIQPRPDTQPGLTNTPSTPTTPPITTTTTPTTTSITPTTTTTHITPTTTTHVTYTTMEQDALSTKPIKQSPKGPNVIPVFTTPGGQFGPSGGDFLSQESDDTGWVTAVSVVALAVILGILLVLLLVFLRRQGCEPLCDLCRCSRHRGHGGGNSSYDDTLLTMATSGEPQKQQRPVEWSGAERSPVYQDPVPHSVSTQTPTQHQYAVLNKKKKHDRLYPRLSQESVVLAGNHM